MRTSNAEPSSRSIWNVPLYRVKMNNNSAVASLYVKADIVTHHMCPLAACKLTWLEYWNAGNRWFNIGSCPTTPRPLTVSSVPDNENIRQFLARNVTGTSPKFSKRMLYRHCKLAKHTNWINYKCSWLKLIDFWFIPKTPSYCPLSSNPSIWERKETNFIIRFLWKDNFILRAK